MLGALSREPGKGFQGGMESAMTGKHRPAQLVDATSPMPGE